MIEKDKKIRKGLPPKREAPCFQLLRDIVIPAGTMLRQASVNRGSTPEMSAQIGLGVGVEGYFSVDDDQATIESGYFKRVIAA